MRLMMLVPDEDSISPQQALQQAKQLYGPYSTIVAMPSSNNEYAAMYFSIQTLVAERLANIFIDCNDSLEYTQAKTKLLNDVTTQFRAMLEDVISDTEDKLKNER